MSTSKPINNRRAKPRRGRARRISVRAVRRDTPDVQRLGRAVVAMALAAQAEAEAQAATTKPDTPPPPMPPNTSSEQLQPPEGHDD